MVSGHASIDLLSLSIYLFRNKERLYKSLGNWEQTKMIDLNLFKGKELNAVSLSLYGTEPFPSAILI